MIYSLIGQGGERSRLYRGGGLCRLNPGAGPPHGLAVRLSGNAERLFVLAVPAHFADGTQLDGVPGARLIYHDSPLTAFHVSVQRKTA